ncbi:MAG: hypothetical protein KUL82_05575 [Bdellovibrio sp.]|nr:hypothetical protein [Bdellovibrio sp.]
MKTLLLICTFLFPLASFASDKMDMACVTEFPTTSFVVREVGDTVVVEVFHHNGTGYMPIFDGLATPNDIATLAARAQTLASLPTVQRYEWPREKCETQDDMIESCFGLTDAQEMNGHKVKAWAFSSSLVMEKSFAGKFNSRKVVLDIDVDGKSFSVPMKYAENECSPYLQMRSTTLKALSTKGSF